MSLISAMLVIPKFILPMMLFKSTATHMVSMRREISCLMLSFRDTLTQWQNRKDPSPMVKKAKGTKNLFPSQMTFIHKWEILLLKLLKHVISKWILKRHNTTFKYLEWTLWLTRTTKYGWSKLTLILVYNSVLNCYNALSPLWFSKVSDLPLTSSFHLHTITQTRWNIWCLITLWINLNASLSLMKIGMENS